MESLGDRYDVAAYITKEDDEGEIFAVGIYCPICARTVWAANFNDVESGDADGFVFVHDDIVHTDEDLRALGMGVQ